MKYIIWLSKNFSLSIPLFLLLGLAVGLSAPTEQLSILIAPLTILMVYPMMVGVKPKQLLVPGGNAVQLWALAINFMFIPFVAMALKGPDLLESPSLILRLFIPLLLLYGINYVISTWVAKKRLNRGDGIALVYGTVMRNLSIALALSMTAFGAAGAQAALLIALAYIIQVQSAAWYVKLSEKLFPMEPHK